MLFFIGGKEEKAAAVDQTAAGIAYLESLEKKDPALWRMVAEKHGVRPEDCTVFDDSLSACKGARAAKMRVVGVYDSYFAADEREMRRFCDVYIKGFGELLYSPEEKSVMIGKK